MVDLRTSRRGYNLHCKYYKRNESGINDDDELINDKKPTGYFQAKREESIYNSNNVVSNSFQFEMSRLTISTMDKIELTSNDIVIIKNQKWIVVDCQVRPIIKNEQFDTNPSSEIFISLRK